MYFSWYWSIFFSRYEYLLGQKTVVSFDDFSELHSNKHSNPYTKLCINSVNLLSCQNILREVTRSTAVMLFKMWITVVLLFIDRPTRRFTGLQFWYLSDMGSFPAKHVLFIPVRSVPLINCDTWQYTLLRDVNYWVFWCLWFYFNMTLCMYKPVCHLPLYYFK